MSARHARRFVWGSAHYPTAASFFSNDNTDSSYYHQGIQVPGFGGLPVDVELTAEERFAHGFDNWAQARLTACEIAMLRLMNDLTDRPGWDDAVCNEGTTIASWRNECLTRDLISDAAWDWCLAELRDTAQTFRETRCIDVFNSASGVCKADEVGSFDVIHALRAGVDALMDEQKASTPLPSPVTRHDVIDPTMYLLAYGATPAVFNTYDHVPLRDIFSSVGQRWSPAPPPQFIEGRRADAGPPLDFEGYIDGPGERSPLMPYDAPRYFWSPGFQLLPYDIQFTESGSGVAISSYINNLHPGRYVAVYKAIESVTAATVPMWNRVLVKQDKDRLPPRIRTYGPLIEPPGPPSWLDRVVRLQNSSVEDRSGPAYQEALSLVKQYLAQPEPPATEMLPTARGSTPWPMHDWDTSQRDFSETIHTKLDRLRHTVHPEPGVSSE